MKQDEKITAVWQMYENGKDYFNRTQLRDKIVKQRMYYEGKQYRDGNDEYPKPIINICRFVPRNKISNILGTPVSISYKTYDSDVNVEAFNHFANYIMKEIRQEEADSRAIRDGAVEGTYIYHYYWDNEATGVMGVKEGAVRVEVLNPLNVMFANPNESDEQKQKYILIVHRKEVEAVKKIADKGIDLDLIVADESESPYEEKEQEGTDYCTVITRYFRINGEVHVEQSTKNVIFNKAKSLKPNVKQVLQSLEAEDEANVGLPDTNRGDFRVEEKFYRYPIVVGSWEERKNSIYGISEVEDLIPNQRAINHGIALQLLESQTAMKYVVEPNALKGQEITSEPMQVLVDYSKTGRGISRLSQNQLSAVPINNVQVLLNLTRMITGATEVMTGETTGSNSSGIYVQSLQAQALKPIEELQQRFWRVKQKQAEVLEQFFKFYYRDKEYFYEEYDKYEDKMVEKNGWFNGNEYEGVRFTAVATVGKSTKWSELGDIQALEVLLNKGAISPKVFIKAYPDSALARKQEIIKALEEEEKSQLNQMGEMLKQYEDTLGKYAQALEESEKAVKNAQQIVNENNSLRKMILELKAEQSGMEQELQQRTQDAQMFANALGERQAENAPLDEEDVFGFEEII